MSIFFFFYAQKYNIIYCALVSKSTLIDNTYAYIFIYTYICYSNKITIKHMNLTNILINTSVFFRIIMSFGPWIFHCKHKNTINSDLKLLCLKAPRSHWLIMKNDYFWPKANKKKHTKIMSIHCKITNFLKGHIPKL